MATPTTLPSTFVAGNVLTAAEMNALRGAFRILQVVSATKTDTFSTTSTSYTDLTGLSVSITPTSADSKIFVMYDLNWSTNTAGGPLAVQILRDSTAVGGGTAAGSRLSANKVGRLAGNYRGVLVGSYLDSPATTSATTYKLQGYTYTGITVYLNQIGNDPDNNEAYNPRTASTITVMEVSA